MKDAIKYSKSLYTFGDNDRKGETKVFETNEPVTKFIEELITKMKDQYVDSTRTAQIYFSHKLVNVKKILLDINERFSMIICFFLRIKFSIYILHLMVNHF